jgi:thymidylate synthase (FAD)
MSDESSIPIATTATRTAPGGSAFTTRDCRLQDDKNRQNSIPVQDRELERFWQEQQQDVLGAAKKAYNNALNAGIAKEVARSVLPEGLSMSRMYVSGTIRSWLHYCEVRTDASTQKEHRDIADKCQVILKREMPALFE